MDIKIVPVGYLQANCYILTKNNQSLIIDPGEEYSKIEKAIDKTKPLAILLTHHHFDHVGALNELQEKYKLPVYEYQNVSEQTYEIGSFVFDVIFTKGHSEDSITYYFKENQTMFTGDFLFKGTIGRTDLETGNNEKMQESLQKIQQYPNGIKIFPGHGDSTTLAHEKQNNPFLRR